MGFREDLAVVRRKAFQVVSEIRDQAVSNLEAADTESERSRWDDVAERLLELGDYLHDEEDVEAAGEVRQREP